MAKVVVLVSGGMDSVTLLHHLLKSDHEVLAMSFNYGQRHQKELIHAAQLCRRLSVRHSIIPLQTVGGLLKGSSQTDPTVAVPLGHYEEKTMKATVVPNRNMVMLSIAAAWGLAEGAEAVYYAAHAGDRQVYPDCRPEFVEALNKALSLCDWKQIQLRSPFVLLSKGDICKLGDTLGVSWRDTWSCYAGGNIHCGQCGTCVERRLAFIESGVDDPTDYAYAGPLPPKPPKEEAL